MVNNPGQTKNVREKKTIKGADTMNDGFRSIGADPHWAEETPLETPPGGYGQKPYVKLTGGRYTLTSVRGGRRI